jgi:tetratricopeptide (TPR) repeat protein
MVNWDEAHLEEKVCPGDTIRVQEYGRAAILLKDETVVRLDQKTALTVEAPDSEKRSLLDLLRGIAHFFSRTPRRLHVATPFVNGAVEGTEFLVTVEADKASILVYEGRVVASNGKGSVTLGKGDAATAQRGSAPIRHIVVRPRDAVQWALYFPPVLDMRPGDFARAGTDWQRRLGEAVELGRSGEPSRALGLLRGAPRPLTDSRFYTYRASLLLQVGRVDEAVPDIQEALKLNPDSGAAYALQTILAVVRNEKDKAVDLAEKSIKLAPGSPAPLIALSYALQAKANLKGALNAAEQATVRAPQDALAWARLSELWLSLGDLDKSLDAARRAADLNPKFSRTQTVLGFAYLAQVKIRKAREAFEEAVRLDSTDPLARLGLGLALIRDGHLGHGRSEIEIAASLDPNDSIFRSYLGKAYFEEKRDKLASREYAVAKELDPLDPTPWFYDAINKQLLNRPVEALQDIQKSIELNDNRAVYRSRLFLDQDLAARSASLGRIYTDLGFDQLALAEGWKSLNTDPSNFSAHRFLADTYSALPRHEIARVSELLQAQLMQPINITPIQPMLTETDLFILEQAGPSALGFNEFNPMFYRNRFALQAGGVAGSNGTLGEEVTQSGLWDKYSYSVSQFHYETNGFRKNNDFEKNLYDVFSQAAISFKTSILAEFRYSDNDEGDLPLRFDEDRFSPNRRKDEEITFFRVGARHTFSPRSEIIGHITLVDGDGRARDTSFPVSIDLSLEDKGYTAEVQHLFRSNSFHLTWGVGHFATDRDQTAATSLAVPPFITDKDSTSIDLLQTNVYAYASVVFPKNFTWTLGASADFFDDESTDRRKLNPKAGLIWNPLPGTTFRAAAFKTLKRPFISDQTIEPTQVAGFNQFFDDADGSETFRYGLAVDQELTTDLYGGVEYSKRNLNVPVNDLTTGESFDANWEERTARAYLYWTYTKWMAASAEYLYEKFERDPDFTGEEEILDVVVHRVPLQLRFFHPCGASLRLGGTYIYQHGEFGNAADGFLHGDDRFWVFDGSIGYRLPKRFGIATFGVMNIFDKKFHFQDTDLSNRVIYPERFVFGRLTLAF